MTLSTNLIKLGQEIDDAKSQSDVPKLKAIIDRLKNYQITNLSSINKLYYHYIYSVALGDLKQRELSPNEKIYDSSLVNQELYHLRLAEKEGDSLVGLSNEQIAHLKSHVYTNLGSVYDHTGRFTEALRVWRLALQLTPNFAMAEYNLGFSLVNTSYYYNSAHTDYLLNYADQLLRKYKDDWRFQRSYPDIMGRLEGLSNTIKKPLRGLLQMPALNLTHSEEDIYRKWCVSNYLYLNQFNDINAESSLSLSDELFFNELIITEKVSSKHKVLFHLFNQIKQEYVSARFMLFLYFNQSGIKHFSDNNVFLGELNEYSEISYNTEIAKSSFRSLYSILDKIAYFLNIYLDLNVPEHEVTFRKIWFSDGKAKYIKSKIKSEDNFPLLALYYIQKDIFCYEKENEFITSPESKMLNKIRNYMEHKCFMLVDGANDYYEEKDLTLFISRSLFEQKAFYLMTTVRAAIIYLKNVVTVREFEKRIKLNIKDNTLLTPYQITNIDPEIRT